MNDKKENGTPERDENGRTWIEANGGLIFGIGTFVAIGLLGLLYKFATG